MIADHPLGVGANQYVIVANTGGYSARAGVPWNTDERAAPVHDAYYLVTAELGFLGLFGLCRLASQFDPSWFSVAQIRWNRVPPS